MATQGEESIPTPQVVGNAFVEQYYNILSKSPEVVHKFYQNSSVISRPDFDGLLSSASTLDGIDKMILSLDYKNCVVEILTTDAQESFGDGVIVLVTGFFTGKDNIRRKFTQLFFLAPQDSRAYYVLNDIFRYVDEEAVVPIKINDADEAAPAAPVTPDPEPTLVSNHSVVDHETPQFEDDNVEVEESILPPDNGKISTDDEVVSSPSVGTSQNDVPPAPPASAGTSQNDVPPAPPASAGTSQNDVPPAPPASAGTVQSDSRSVSEATVSNVQEDLPKKSYASVANALNYKKQPFQQRILPAKPVEHLRATVVPEASPPPADNKPVEKNNTDSVKGYSIFVANLPMNATAEQLIETFEKFGPIKPNGVQVRSYKQEKNCFGFVEFESANSMHSALEASSIRIGDRVAHIEEKKANNEGGKLPMRKGSFRNDSFRNRKNFSGGRGYGRNEFENQSGSSGQSRGTVRHNAEGGNQKVYQNGGGRVARQAQAQAEAQV